MPTMNIQISLKFHAVCAASKVLQNYNDLGKRYTKTELYQTNDKSQGLAPAYFALIIIIVVHVLNIN